MTLPIPKLTEAEKNREKTYRPWGYFKTIDHGPGFHVKAIWVNPRERLSLQRHAHRDERWTVCMGVAVVTINGVKHAGKPGDVFSIQRGTWHRIANPAIEPLVFIEVQVGDDLREDDIERMADDYGRADVAGGVVVGSPSILIGDGNPEKIVPLNEGKA